MPRERGRKELFQGALYNCLSFSLMDIAVKHSQRDLIDDVGFHVRNEQIKFLEQHLVERGVNLPLEHSPFELKTLWDIAKRE